AQLKFTGWNLLIFDGFGRRSDGDHREVTLEVRQDGTVVGCSNIQGDIVAAGDFEGFLSCFDGKFLTIVPVLIFLNAFRIEVGNVGGQVGETPGDVLVVADHNAGQTRESESADIIGTLRGDFGTPQLHLMPYRRQRSTQVWVVC